jgi:hypothetical protein
MPPVVGAAMVSVVVVVTFSAPVGVPLGVTIGAFATIDCAGAFFAL